MPSIQTRNLFQDLPDALAAEALDTLFSNPSLRIERIVSQGQSTPDQDWYDQREDEWVMLVQGAARLSFEDPAQNISMTPGDHILIPAHCRHRVDWTPPDQATIWIAVHAQSLTESRNPAS